MDESTPISHSYCGSINIWFKFITGNVVPGPPYLETEYLFGHSVFALDSPRSTICYLWIQLLRDRRYCAHISRGLLP